LIYLCFFFFFQAEDGIRDYKVTGVQTCALPISTVRFETTSSAAPVSRGSISGIPACATSVTRGCDPEAASSFARASARNAGDSRSEERRVGKEWRARGARAPSRRKG